MTLAQCLNLIRSPGATSNYGEGTYSSTANCTGVHTSACAQRMCSVCDLPSLPRNAEHKKKKNRKDFLSQSDIVALTSVSTRHSIDSDSVLQYTQYTDIIGTPPPPNSRYPPNILTPIVTAPPPPVHHGFLYSDFVYCNMIFGKEQDFPLMSFWILSTV